MTLIELITADSLFFSLISAISVISGRVLALGILFASTVSKVWLTVLVLLFGGAALLNRTQHAAPSQA